MGYRSLGGHYAEPGPMGAGAGLHHGRDHLRGRRARVPDAGAGHGRGHGRGRRARSPARPRARGPGAGAGRGARPELAAHQDPVLTIEGDDRDRARVADDVAPGAPAVGRDDLVDTDLEVVAAMDGPGADDGLAKTVVGRMRARSGGRSRRCALGAVARVRRRTLAPVPGRRPRWPRHPGRGVRGRQALAAAAAGIIAARASPVSASNRWSRSAGIWRSRMSPGRTLWDAETTAMTSPSWPATVTGRGSSLPRYSTTAALARIARGSPRAPSSRCSGRNPATTARDVAAPTALRKRLGIGKSKPEPFIRSPSTVSAAK